MEAGWLIHELAQRTRYCHFPPLVATCTNEDKGECSAILRTGQLLARVLSTCCSGSGTTRARASAPASSTTTSTVTAPPVRLKVRSGAWNTGWHDGSGFTQRISSSTPQRTLTRLGRDQPGHRRRPPQCGRHRSPRPGCVPPARASPSCGPRPAATFSGATPGCSAATTISTMPPTSWIRQWRAYHLIPPDYALPAN